jgi:6-phospho-beta-glucosidase
MKLTVIGGGSVRTPQLIPTLISRADALSLDELWLMDIQADKLNMIGGLCQAMAESSNAPFKIVMTTSAEDAIRDADHIITSIRPAYEKGRAIDEQICFNHGVLGQETTGAAGFAMAMRSAPAILHYARMVEKIAKPNAWVFNFTNPAGLVTQVLHDAGIQRVVGICDSANKAQIEAGQMLDIPLYRLQHEVYGLNHLSWTRSVNIDADENNQNGEEVLKGLLTDEAFIQRTHMNIFDEGLRHWQGTFMNEYLHYYYHRDDVLQSLIAKEESRGEEVLRLTTDMLNQLQSSGSVDEQLKIYHDIMNARSNSYMAHAHETSTSSQESHDEDEGYAGVALSCVEAIARDKHLYTGLNVPNSGTISGMRDSDIVEVGCHVDSNGIHPVPIGDIPDHQYQLMLSIKQYERLASEAILSRSKDTAIQALTVHPLVGSYPLAEKLVNDFINAHQEWIGEWQ